MEKKEKTILQKLLVVQKEIKSLKKEGKNEHGNYKYLSDEQLMPYIKDLLEKEEIKFNPYNMEMIDCRVNPKNTQLVYTIKVEYSFIDTNTGEELKGVAIGSGGDSVDKGIFKAITGAIKYIFIKHFLIPTTDDPEFDKYDKKIITNDDIDI
jgi:hypothetical protein